MKIGADAYRTIIHHVHAAWPYEACGILLTECDSADIVSMVMLSQNASKKCQRRYYRLDHKVQLMALELECSGLAEVMGYFHSHPNSEPLFSQEDVRLAVEGAIYVVVGGERTSLQVRAWRINGAGIAEEPVEVEKKPWIG